MPTSTPAQNVCDGWWVCCGLFYVLRSLCLGPVMPDLLRAGRGLLHLLAARLSTSVNQQTLPMACSGLSTFLSALGRVWGRKKEATLIKGAWASRPEAPRTIHMVGHAWDPPKVHSSLPSNHRPSFYSSWGMLPSMACLPCPPHTMTGPGSRSLQDLLGPPRCQSCWLLLSSYFPGLLFRASPC